MNTVMPFIVAASVVSHASCTERPIIGILAQESDQYLGRNDLTVIPGSYVQMMQGSGARVVPIFTNKSQSYYDYILSSINGVIFPGGAVNIMKKGGMVETGNLVYEYAMKANKHGNVFPILGICQGLELLSYLSNNKVSPLTPCKGMINIELPLEFVVDYATTSLFKNAKKEDIYTLINKNSTVNYHRWCLTRKSMKKFGLDKQWHSLTVNKDSAGLEFVSSIESYQYPFVGLQFHPEKSSYEWKPDQKNAHFMEAISANRIFYDWLAAKARESNNRFKSVDEEMDALILNYQPKFTGKSGGRYELLYIFP